MYANTTAFCTLDLLQECCQMPLSYVEKSTFTMVPPGLKFYTERFRKVFITQQPYPGSVTRDALGGLVYKVCLVWIDDVVTWGDKG